MTNHNKSQNTKRPEWNNDELAAFKNRVMKRVYFSWFIRKVLLPAFLILPATIYLLVKELSNVAVLRVIGTVIIKISHFNLLGLLNFGVDAVRFTEIDGLLVMTSSFLLAIFFGRKILRDFYAYLYADPLALPSWSRLRRS